MDFKGRLVSGKNNVAAFDRAYEGVLDKVQAAIERSLEYNRDTLTDMLKENFDSEESKTGSPWRPLALSTQIQRSLLGYSGPMLQRTGGLREAAFHAVRFDVVPGSGSSSRGAIKVTILPDENAETEAGEKYSTIAKALNKGYYNASKESALYISNTAKMDWIHPDTQKLIAKKAHDNSFVPGRQFMYITASQKSFFLRMVKTIVDSILESSNPNTYEVK